MAKGRNTKTQKSESKDNTFRKSTKKSTKSNTRKGKDSIETKTPENEYGTTKGVNDVSWYSNHPQLLKDVASIPYAYPVGKELPGVVLDFDYEPANIVALRVLPTIGSNTNALSPINVAMRSLHSYVNYANSRNTSYDDTDLMLYILAMDSAYAYYYNMIRIYGLARLYSQYNRNLPDTLLKAIGVDGVDIRENLADFRAYINTYAWRLGSFFVPNIFSYITRHSWLYSNVYLDDPSKKGSMYVFTPEVFYSYDETSVDTGGQLVAEFWRQDNTFTTIMELGNHLLDKLQLAQDIGIIGSDILKAFGEDKLIKVSTISEDYIVSPVYEPEVLQQIQNATICGNISMLQGAANIVQKDQYLYQLLRLSDPATSVGIAGGNRLLNSVLEDPTPGDTMVATRLMATSTQLDNIDIIDACGSEVITHMEVYSNKTVMKPFQYVLYAGGDYGEYGGELANELVSSAMLSNFTYHPFLYRAIEVESSDNTTNMHTGIIGNLANYTILQKADLDLMHRSALLSMFHVPAYGTMK